MGEILGKQFRVTGRVYPVLASDGAGCRHGRACRLVMIGEGGKHRVVSDLDLHIVG